MIAWYLLVQWCLALAVLRVNLRAVVSSTSEILAFPE